MLGELDKGEIIDLLERQIIGRLGCHVDGETYVVPINYVYLDNAVYAHSGMGKKIEMMRKNPEVCFQVDEVEDTFRWKSVVLWGTYEELEDEERQQALMSIIHRIMPLRDKPSLPASHGVDDELRDNIVVYRINITEGTGRFESHED